MINKKYRTGIDAELDLSIKLKQLSTESVDNQNDKKNYHEHKTGSVLCSFFRKKEHISMRNFKVHLKSLLRPIYTRIFRDLSIRINEQIKQEIHKAFLNESTREVKLSADTLSRLERIESYSYSTAHRVVVNCSTEEVLVKASVGYVLCSSMDYALLACLIDTGELEPGTRRLIEKFINSGDIFIDVGANIGLHTIAAAKKMNTKGKVYAFEPYQPTVELLTKSLLINGLTEIVQVYPLALSSESGRYKLHLGKTSGHHSLHKFVDNSISAIKSVDVDVKRMDEIISPAEQIHLIKIDAEGAELSVIAGAEKLIDNNPDIAMIVEFGPSHLSRVGIDVDDWFDVFTRFGMTFKVIDPISGELQISSIDNLRNVESVNLFFSKPDSDAWKRLKD